MEDLWPSELVGPLQRAPVTILREQAGLLGKKTQNRVQAEVKSGSVDAMFDAYDFAYAFRIVAPALSNYSYELFTIRHRVTLYPVTLLVPLDLRDELVLDEKMGALVGRTAGGEPRRTFTARDEEQYLVILKAIFAAKKTIRVINALLAQMDEGPSIESTRASALEI